MTFLILLILLGAISGFIAWFFTPRRKSDSLAPISPPAPTPPPEPSCVAKGIAKAWVDDQASWTISRKKIKVPCISSHSGSVTITYYQVILKHAKLGILIQCQEYESYAAIFSLSALVNDQHVIQDTNYGPMSTDNRFLLDTITANPYLALKRRIDQATKAKDTRAARIKDIEKLGCP